MAIKKGTKVRQIVPVIEGEVAQVRFNDSAEKLEYRVPFIGADGEPSERWFLEGEIEAADTQEGGAE